MEVKAFVKDTGISARKLRPLVDLVRGKRVEEALTILRYVPTPHALIVSKVIKSAVSNAENNYQISADSLKVTRIFADNGKSMKRYRPRSRGMASHILKRSSHITVIVADQES